MTHYRSHDLIIEPDESKGLLSQTNVHDLAVPFDKDGDAVTQTSRVTSEVRPQGPGIGGEEWGGRVNHGQVGSAIGNGALADCVIVGVDVNIDTTQDKLVIVVEDDDPGWGA